MQLAQVENVCYWIKQLVAVACGAGFGSLPVLGTFAVVTFLVLAVLASASAPIVAGAPLDAEGHIELLKEGLQPAFALYMVVRCTTFTMVHH